MASMMHLSNKSDKEPQGTAVLRPARQQPISKAPVIITRPDTGLHRSRTHPLRPPVSKAAGELDAEELRERLEAHVIDQRARKNKRPPRAREIAEKSTKQDTNLEQKDDISPGSKQNDNELLEERKTSRPKYNRAPSSCPSVVGELDMGEKEPLYNPRIDPEDGIFHPRRRRLDQDPILRARYAENRRSMGLLTDEDQDELIVLPAGTAVVEERASRKFSLQDWTQHDEIDQKRSRSLIDRTKSLLLRRRPGQPSTSRQLLEQPGSDKESEERPRKHSLLGRFREES